MQSHFTFLNDKRSNYLNRLIFDTIDSYVEVYVLPNINHLIALEGTARVKKILENGAIISEEEFEENLDNALQDDDASRKIKNIYVMLRRLISEPISEIDTLGNTFARMNIRLTNDRTVKIREILRTRIYSAIDPTIPLTRHKM